MRDFLIEMFEINQQANLKMVENVELMPESVESIKLLSHLANCQYKWLDRIEVFPNTSALDWWEPVYAPNELKHHIIESTRQWVKYFSDKTDDELESIRQYVGYDGSIWECKLKDIALQLTFHSYHHRAQIQMMIRSQGGRPKFIDYIGYKQKKAGPN